MAIEWKARGFKDPEGEELSDGAECGLLMLRVSKLGDRWHWYVFSTFAVDDGLPIQHGDRRNKADAKLRAEKAARALVTMTCDVLEIGYDERPPSKRPRSGQHEA